LPIAASLPESEQLINTLKGHKEVVSIVAYSPDGRVLASGTTQGTVILWHPSSGKLLRTLIDNRPNLSSIAFSPDSRVLAVGRYRQQHGRMSGEIELWDISSGKLERSLKEENGGAVRRIGFLPDGKTMAAIITGQSSQRRRKTEVILLDVESGKERSRFEIPAAAALLAPDAKTVVTASRQIQVWDVQAGRAA